MKHLRQYIRRIILSEGIKRPSDLLPGSYILVELDPNKISSAKLMVPTPDAPWASKIRSHTVMAQVDWGTFYLDKPCMGASEVTFANVSPGYLEAGGYSDTDGWGPLLYDIAMEFQGEKGLMCDRDEVSLDASKVWEKYLTARDDVQPKVLDTKDGFYTNTKRDDCDQTTFQRYTGNMPWESISTRAKMKKHWASQVFVKISGTPVIDELRANGKIKVTRI